MKHLAGGDTPVRAPRAPRHRRDGIPERPDPTNYTPKQFRQKMRSYVSAKYNIPIRQLRDGPSKGGGTEAQVRYAFENDDYAQQWAAEGHPPPIPSPVFLLKSQGHDAESPTVPVYEPRTAAAPPVPPDTPENLLARTRALARALEAAATKLNAMADELEAMMLGGKSA